MQNAAYDVLVTLGIVDPQRIEHYADTVRDRSDISVKRCAKSGVIFLDNSAQAQEAYYVTKGDDSAAVQTLTETIPVTELEDTARRAEQFASQIRGKNWIDFGTGRGQILDALKDVARSATGVEPNELHRTNIAARGNIVVRSIGELPERSADVITLFHVLEHLEDPVGLLRTIATRLVEGGRIVIEVPHARDALLDLYDCQPFRQFTLWSEHLVLHTRESLRAVIEAAGLRCAAVTGYQRFPVSNHLHWLRTGRPGGHEKWSFLDAPALMEAYAAALNQVDATDTLIAYASCG